MSLSSDVTGSTLIFLGIDIIIGSFLLALTFRVRRVRAKLSRFLFVTNGIFVAESVFLTIGFLGLSFLQSYSELSASLQMLTVMLIFYVGMVRVKRN